MVVFLTGASGFVGRHLAAALVQRRHSVIFGVRPGRRLPGEQNIEVDFTCDFDPSVWRERLNDIDAVINAVGIGQEHGDQSFESLHLRAPRALFAACAEAGVARVIQISALGSNDGAKDRFHQTKLRADLFLSELPISSAVVQPSLIYGPGGASARLLDQFASLPLIPVPGEGSQRIQPIHIDDVVDAIVALLDRDTWRTGRIALVGPETLTLREFLTRLRSALGLPRARFVRVPGALVRTTVSAESLRAIGIDDGTGATLERGVADPQSTRELIGRAPRAVERFIAPGEAPRQLRDARLGWLLPLIRLSIAIVWIATAIVSLFFFPAAESRALLARAGISATAAPWALTATALLAVAMGIATLFAPSRRLWWTQAALIAGGTVLISVFLPEYWAHPFGPVVKNLPLLAALSLLIGLEKN